MLDNLLYAHGREAFSGDRRVYAAMADPGSWSEYGHELDLPEYDPITGLFEEKESKGNTVSDQETGADLEEWFLAAVASELQVESVEKSDNFVDLGGDSLSGVALLEESDMKFGIEVDLDVFLSAETLGEILDELRKERDAQ